MVRRGAFLTRRDGVVFVEKALKEMKLSNRDRVTASINAEHAIHHIENAFKEDTREYEIIITKTMFAINITIEAEGRTIDFEEDTLGCDDFNEEVPFFGRPHDIYEYKRNKGINHIRFNVEESDAKDLLITLATMILGILAGFIIRNCCGDSITNVIEYYGLDLVQGLFMNALKIIVGPVVFFSLCTCVARFKNLGELGRIGIKTLCLYLFTTMVAIGIGITLYTIHPVGSSDIAESITQAMEEDEEAQEEFLEVSEGSESADFSIRNMIANIVPDNFFMPFINVSLLQIIFLGIIVGIGIGKSGKYSDYLCNLSESINQLLGVITEMVTAFIPLAVFCAMAKLVIDTGFEALKSILSFAVLVVAGMLIMVVFYCIFMFATTGLNPFIFLKKFSKAITSAFATSSATAIMPTSIKCCKDMGMDEKIVSFTIPFGANINMDGSSMVFILAVMFMSKIYGIDLTGSLLITTIVSIVFLALGSPSVAGADLVIIAVLLKQVGIPMEAIGLILGVDAIFDMIQAVSNTTGDAVVSLVVSKSEGLLDVKKYNS